jgi:16S rRNA (guanine(1405)-N(7))-methyltransferase
MPDRLEQIAARILSSRKYRWLCPATVERVVQWAARRWPGEAEIERGARRKLHQVYGAYLGNWDDGAAARLAAELDRSGDDAQRRAACRRIMELHSSTRERLAIVGEFYRLVLAGDHPQQEQLTERAVRVLDIGCGLNAFAMPWIRDAAEVDYVGWEIDSRLVDLVNDCAAALGGRIEAHLRDALAGAPEEPFDVVWMLKMLPTLMRQDADAAARMLDNLPARRVVVSFPARSLGGRDKGMTRNYSRMMEGLLAGRGRAHRRDELPGELVYTMDLA